MKKILLFSFMFIYGHIISCSGYDKSFCYVQYTRPNDLVVKGVVVGFSANALQLEVLDVLRGTETRSVITIWDGTDFNCNGNYSMKVSGIAQAGDTILAVLPKIQTVVNSWDVVGDYSRPLYLFANPVLPIKNGVLTGLITGNTYNAQQASWAVYKMDYEEFKSSWSKANTLDCAYGVGLAERAEYTKDMILSKEGTKISVSLPNQTLHSISVISLQGSVIKKFQSSVQFDLDIEGLEAGVYLISAEDSEGVYYRSKFVR